jgi:hypothetical protein
LILGFTSKKGNFAISNLLQRPHSLCLPCGKPLFHADADDQCQ